MACCSGRKTQKSLLAFMGNNSCIVFCRKPYCGLALMAKTILILMMAAALVAASYIFGVSRTKTEILTKKVEVIRYVERKKSEIYARPNADRNALLELMRKGKL